MKNRETDFLVVGASYAGSILAAKLAEKGDVTLVDKSQPGELMNCGGGLPRETLEKLKIEIPFARTSRVMMNIKGLERSFPAEYVVVDRRDLNKALFEKALASGAEFARMSYTTHDDTEKIAEFAHKGVTSVIKYGKLIFADGFHPSRPRITTRNKAKAPCGAAKTQIFKGLTPYPDTLYFKMTEDNPSGYSWIFPMPDGKINIGAGSFHSSHVSDSLIDNLKKSENLNGDTIIKGGGILPVSPVPKVQDGDIFLFGNAAGMVHPPSGEGLKYISDASDIWAETIISGKNLNLRWRFSSVYLKLKLAEFALRTIFAGSKILDTPLYPAACRATAKSRNIIQF